jgi:gamma-glutamyl:cysteine ligase YbdK (ATP-grasp superfamily)
MNRLVVVESPPELPADADERMGRLMVDIARDMHERLDEALAVAADPIHVELRDWATRLGACGAGRLPANDRLRLSTPTASMED